MLTFAVLNLVFSFMAILGNLLVIRAPWKASSIPVNFKKLLLSLAFSDLAVGLLSQPMFGVIIVVMLKMVAAANGNDNPDFFCPTVLNVSYFFLFLLPCALLLGVTAIAVDRLLVISLHLRYQELVTSKRVVIALMCSWLTSAAAASIFISLPAWNRMVIVSFELVELLSASVAYIHIYRVAIYHQNHIQSQLSQLQNVQPTELLREKKSDFNALFVYFVLASDGYLQLLCFQMLLLTNTFGNHISLLVAHYTTVFFVFLNSSLNPLAYCWRYREVREIAKSTVTKVFRFNETGR